MPPAPTRGRIRWLTVAACLALLVGVAVAVSDIGGGPDGQEVVTAPDLDTGSLDLAGPTDGRQSAGLPVQATPATMLVDGQLLTVTGTGFVPGEAVGIVQCSQEAARLDRGGEAAGVDACDLAPYTALEADDLGGVTGTYAVQRALTTAWTGTVDCAERPGRCIVVIGSVRDYDRSGGFGVSFATEGLAPVAVPTLAVSPSVDLVDGDTVTVTGTGFPAGSTASLSLCSLDPSTCWAIGAHGGEPSGSGAPPAGAVADDAGRFEVGAAVWRHLPGPEPSTYVDCAHSPCVVRATLAERLDGTGTIEVEATIPAPVRLGFRGGGGGPTPATIAVSPTEGVSVGDVVTVTGAGFRPGEEVVVLQCVTERAAGDLIDTCAALSDASTTVDGDGRFEAPVETVAMRMSRPAVCDESGACEAPDGDDVVDCADDAWTCDIRVRVDGAGDGRPPFPPSPVVLVVEG